MNHRNLLLLGLSSIALQGCVAAAAIPIVAGGGALVRDSVSDDARSGSRERVSVVPPPAPTPTPTSAPALAAAQPAQPVSTATPPISIPTPSPTPSAAAIVTRRAEPVVVATLDDYRPASRSAPTPTPTPTPASIAATQLPQEPEAALPAANTPREELAVTRNAEEPVAAATEPRAERLADIGLPPEPAAQEREDTPALAAATPSTEPAPAESMPVEPAQSSMPEVTETETSLAVAEPEPAAPAPAQEPEPVEEAFVAAQPPAEPPAAATNSAFPAANPMGGGYDALRGYALRTLGGGLPLPSAMLADPTSLQPVRRDCQGNAPTVVIDLDPAGGVVPIAGPLAVNTDLARILSELRLRDVQIAWVTDRGPIDARAVRDRLVASGLDPASQDSLYVERYPGETKQARRAALAQTQCVIALAGDERSDFDDLYNYIIEPGDARNLELLLGNGWFLIENPVGE